MKVYSALSRFSELQFHHRVSCPKHNIGGGVYPSLRNIINVFFDIEAGVLQGDTLAPYLFIICLDYVLRTSIDNIKENGFELTKERSRRYPAKIITDADYADDIAILANAPAQAETLLHCLEWAAAGIGLHVTKRNICALIKQARFPH